MASCRACGGELEQIALCPTCEESVQWKCIVCSEETDVSVHTHGGRIVRARVTAQSEQASAARAALFF